MYFLIQKSEFECTKLIRVILDLHAVMGEAKRRKSNLGQDYGKEKPKFLGIKLDLPNQDKLRQWVIEGLVISAVSLALIWGSLYLS